MPNYYLREYADLDLGVISDDIESATAYYSSTFTNEKVSLGYQHRLADQKWHQCTPFQQLG